MDTVALVKFVICNMLTYCYSVNRLPLSLIKAKSRCIKNFIWFGNSNSKKLVLVAWSQVRKPYMDGGLEIRSTRQMNDASMLKLGWELVSDNQWT